VSSLIAPTPAGKRRRSRIPKGNPVSGMPHEFRKLIHALALSHPPQSVRYALGQPGTGKSAKEPNSYVAQLVYITTIYLFF